MHPTIKPVFYLMSRLSYRGKFIVICSVFAIPLAVFAFQLASSYHKQADQAQKTRDGLNYIQKASVLLLELETLRDLKVITSWSADPVFSAKFIKSRAKALQQVNTLLQTTKAPHDQTFLQELKLLIEQDEKTQGIESGSIDAVYEDAHATLDKVYKWRAKLSYSLISNSRNNTNTLSVINLLNESDIYTRALGKARTYGSLYLVQQYVDSYGGQVLERTYQELSNLIDLLELKDSEYKSFFMAFPDSDLKSLKKSLIDGRELFYEKLILATETTSNPHAYFDQLTDIFERIYAYNQSLFSLSNDIVESDYQHSLEQLSAFYLSAVCITLLLIYLALGLYHSIAITIRELLRSAAFFAAGKYDRPVEVVSRDELTAVAEAMDSMRLNIKEREEKLAFMSQTDGLTKLSNRKFFDQALKVSLANSRRNLTPLSIVMIDIDFFKKVNDKYGHLAGDDCLIKIAELIKDQFKRQTDVVARYGGEEFIAILYGLNLEEAYTQTEKLRQTIETTPITSGETTYNVTASFGLASLIPPEEAKPQELIALADALLYASKDKGRNCISAKNYCAQDV